MASPTDVSSANNIVHELLNMDNYEHWSLRVKTYLLAEGLWKVVEATGDPPKLEDERFDVWEVDAWSKQNAKALHVIHISCGSRIFSLISDTTSAREAWVLLAKKFKIDYPEEGAAGMQQLYGKMRIVASHWYGGTGGDHWDDGILYDGVREIHVKYGAAIDSIGIVYTLGGQVTKPEMHGGNGGGGIMKISLDYPREYLTHVSGYCKEAHWFVQNPVVIRSIKFQTNVRTYGPYGEEGGRPFNFSIAKGEKVIGFHGRKGELLDAIGLHVSQQ